MILQSHDGPPAAQADRHTGNVVPKWGPRLARLYSEDVRRLEALHANGLAPGAKTWEQAVEALYKRMVEVGPAKGAKLLQKAIDYLNSVNKDARRHLLLASHCRSRNVFMLFATFSYGAHPDPRVSKEEGLTIELHVLHCSRSCPSRSTGIPVAFVSRHAMNRLYERGHDITDNSHATGVFAFIGLLGFLTHRSEKHVGGGMHMAFSDLLVVGSLHRFTKTSYSGRQFEETMFDARTVLLVEGLGDSQWAMLEQGKAATSAVVEWFQDTAGDPEQLAETIPYIKRREDGYPARVTQVNTKQENIR